MAGSEAGAAGPSDRQVLVEELAVEIAGFMRGYGDPAHHSYMSAFEACCAELWSLGAAVPADPEEPDAPDGPHSDPYGRFPSLFRILPAAEIRRRIAASPPLADEAFARLMDAFVGKLDYLPERFPVHRDWFAPAPPDRPLLEALRRCGFAACADGRYRWTDAMLPHMAARGFWTENGEEHSRLLAEEVRAFLSQLPDAVRYELIGLARRPGAPLFVLKRVTDGLQRENWLRHFPLHGNSPVSIARQIHQLLAPDR